MRKRFLAAASCSLGLLVGGWSHAYAGERVKVRISGRDCARLVQHRPRDDVAYRPGVDVHGRKVAPADLPGSRPPLKLPQTVEFDIAFNPLKGTSKSRFGETSIKVGRVRYDIARGTFTFNGQPLTDPQIAALSRKCREAATPRR